MSLEQPEQKRRTPLTTDAAGLSFFIQREGEKLPPFQYLRELVLNGCEAGAVTIWIDYIEEEGGRLLLRVTDNGSGMDEEKLRTHIKSLFFSGKELGENHGMGARVATLARNPEGVTWASRVDEEENMVKVIKDQNNIFSLENWPLDEPKEDGSITDDVVDPDEGILRDELLADKNGTAVILHGDGRNDTWPGRNKVESYLIKRWWELPGEVKVWDPSARGGGCWRRVKSLQDFIEENALTHSTIDATIEDVGFVRIHWALLREGLDDWQGLRSGGIGVLLENELFRWENIPYRMMQFGITSRSVQKRIVIAIELTETIIDESDGWRMTIGRDDVERIDGRNAIDWSKIGEAFVEQMPTEISALLVADSNDSDFQKIIHRRFNEEWREIVEYLPKGDNKGSSNEQASKKPGTFKTKGKRKRGKKVNHGVTNVPKNTGQKRNAKEKQEEITTTTNIESRYQFPSVEWISDEEFGGLPGRAATFVKNKNQILMVEDHIFLTQAIVHAQREFPNVSASVIEARVKNEFKLETVAKVVHVNVLHRDERFTKEDFDSLLSDDALTTALAGMHAIALRINKSLSVAGR